MCFLMPLQGESIAERAVAQFTFEWFDAQVHFLVLPQVSCLTEGGLTPRALVWFLSKNDNEFISLILMKSRRCNLTRCEFFDGSKVLSSARKSSDISHRWMASPWRNVKKFLLEQKRKSHNFTSVLTPCEFVRDSWDESTERSLVHSFHRCMACPFHWKIHYL